MLLLALAVAVGSMHGTITFERYPLPGVTVKVMSGSFFASRIANATGSYAFDEVPPGSYDRLRDGEAHCLRGCRQ